MIGRLRRRLIFISIISVLAVVLILLAVIIGLNVSTMNRNMDLLADKVSDGGGKFPGYFDEKPHPDVLPPSDRNFGFITPETPFATRHFTVVFNENGEVISTFTDSIYSITEEQAVEYAKSVIDGRGRGWLSSYRYKLFESEQGRGVVFVDGSMNMSVLVQTATISCFVLLGCGALVLLFIILLSGRAVKPIADSYERQKQFVTDANHELKTPLTLILTNLDIAESELGQNEWLDDIRAEGNRMSELVNQLVELSRMDEESSPTQMTDVAIGELIFNRASEFEPLATDRGKKLSCSIDRSLVCRGNEALLHRLVDILLDNAIKYCDNGGEISLSLQGGRRVSLTVENNYTAVDELELSRLFDRFYRADKARTFTGGYGVGLSMAKAIAEKHKTEITAYKRDGVIGFKITL